MVRTFCIMFVFFNVAVCQETPPPTTENQSTQNQPAKSSSSEDPELKKLQDAILDATSQQGMNVASGNVSKYLDKKLVALEMKIAQKLTDAEKIKFAESIKQWQTYRKNEVKFRSDFFDGGSIQPLMTNSIYGEITQHRIAELKSFFESTLEGRAIHP